MEKIGGVSFPKSTEVIAIVACIGLIITIILAAGQSGLSRRRLIWSCIQAVCKRNRQMLVF